jgi:pimeloyl-ACP methyl ester carboxylesterase
MTGPATTEGRIAVPGGHIWYQVINPDRAGTPLMCLHGGPGMPHDYLEPLTGRAVEIATLRS